jgi:hypothetical protein
MYYAMKKNGDSRYIPTDTVGVDVVDVVVVVEELRRERISENAEVLASQLLLVLTSAPTPM